METIKYLTRGNVSPQGKQRIYFSSHEEDFVKFEEIAKEILTLHDVAIFHSDVEKEKHLDNLSLMNLIIFPITRKFLYGENDSRLIDLKFAIKNKIPVLPIVYEENLELEFNKICGDIQCLNKLSRDITQLGFEEKLEDFLKDIIVHSNLKNEIYDVFNGSLFLSYRKKDRKYAQELIKKIHEKEELQSYSIWYDEFLVLGEDYSDNIEEEIKKASIVIIAVTPSLLEENNYVLNVEYPLAKKYNKKIVPIEVVKTDYEEMKSLYKDFPRYYDLDDESDFNEIYKTCDGLKVTNELSTDNRYYLLGLAYLYGVGVENNIDRAISYLEKASEFKHVLAKQTLGSIYFEQKYIKPDYDKAISLFKDASIVSKAKYRFTRDADAFIEMIEALQMWGDYLFRSKRVDNAIEPYLIMKTECIVASQHLEIENLDDLLIEADIKIGDAYFQMHKFEEAEKSYFGAYSELGKDKKYLQQIITFTELCDKLSKTYFELGDMQKNRAFMEVKVSLLNQFTRVHDDFELALYHSKALYGLGDIFFQEGDFVKAEELFADSINRIQKAYESSNMLDSEISFFFDSAYPYLKLGKIYGYSGRYEEAFGIFDYLTDNYINLFRENFEKVEELLVDIEMEKGTILFQKGKYEEALEKYKSFLMIEEKLLSSNLPIDKQLYIEYSLKLCQCLSQLNKHKTMEYYLLKVIPLIEEKKKENTIRSNRYLILSNILISEYFTSLGEYEKAEKSLLTAVDIAREIHDEIYGTLPFMDLLMAYRSIGLFYLKNNQKDKATKFYNEIYDLTRNYVNKSNDLSILDQIVKSSVYLATLYKDEQEVGRMYLSTAIKAKTRYLEFINDEDGELELADYYLLMFSMRIEEPDLESLDNAKEIIMNLFKRRQDEQVMSRVQTLLSITKALEEVDNE